MAIISLLVLILASVSLSSDGGVAALCSSPYCPPPWRAFQGHCYLWVDKLMSWMDAERHCQMLSHPGKMAHLVSIHSKEEDEFIGEYSQTNRHWIGFNDHVSEGDFTWTDGSNASYTSWTPGEPNNDRPQEDCAEKYASTTWNDNYCLRLMRFICKK
ncbi:echinoidin-like [Patiria miniata]|uniref:C-type lectin domain-containing protein n=1 Tax=Patiria miniata TaxID=46514 RepID=A0A914A7T7_PATMI|nr:echinoidin-like [Patiria miniata]